MVCETDSNLNLVIRWRERWSAQAICNVKCEGKVTCHDFEKVTDEANTHTVTMCCPECQARSTAPAQYWKHAG